jgi:hypothetical protein
MPKPLPLVQFSAEEDKYFTRRTSEIEPYLHIGAYSCIYDKLRLKSDVGEFVDW